MARQKLTPVSGSLRSARERFGHSQQQAAEAMKVSMAAVCRWEAGTRTPTGLYRQVLADYLAAAAQAKPHDAQG